jgi:hypothetical protein
MEQDPEIRKELSEIGRRGAFLRKAIAGRKAEIERINRNLDNLPAPGSSSRFGQPVQVSQKSIDLDRRCR